MNQKFNLLTVVILMTITVGCSSEPAVEKASLTAAEIKMCSSVGIDTTVVNSIRKYNDQVIGKFENNGLIFVEQYDKTPKLLSGLKDELAKKGCTIFVYEDNFGLMNKPNKIVVLKTTDKYAILKQMNTNGTNVGIDNDSVISIVRKFDQDCSLEITGAANAWCEFKINKAPKDWKAFAEEVYKICPDIVDQGTGTVDELAKEMKELKRLYLWWD